MIIPPRVSRELLDTYAVSKENGRESIVKVKKIFIPSKSS